jgi:hypothetical protein
MIAAAVLVAQYAGTLEVFDTTRMEARASQPLPVITGPPREIALAADALTMPSARLRLKKRRWDLTLTYSPTLAVTDIELGSLAQPSAINAGTAILAWRDRLVRMTLSESASYGVQSAGFVNQYPQPGQTMPGQTMPGQTAASGSAVPAITLFPFASSITNVSLLARATRRLTLSLSGGYSLNGDPIANRQEVTNGALPEQFGPSATASIIYALSRVATVTTLVTGQETTTPLGACVPAPPPPTISYCREVQPSVSVQEVARQVLSAHTALVESVGASAAVVPLENNQGVADVQALGILPIAGLTFTGRFGTPDSPPGGALRMTRAATLVLSAQLAPAVDVRTGFLSDRIQPTVTLTSRVAPRVYLGANVGAVQSIPIPRRDPSPLTAFSGGLDVRLRVTRWVDVNLGVQAYWQNQELSGTLASSTAPESASEIGYVSVTARSPMLRF